MLRQKVGDTYVNTVVSNKEWQIHEAIKNRKFADIQDLNEQDRHTADLMFQRNLLRKVRSGGRLGYTTHTFEIL